MTTLACPYCYHRVDGNRLWFQCTGRGSPGRPGCRPAVDAERQRQTGFNQPSRPVFAPGRVRPAGQQAACPRCGAVSGIRVCPSCHTPLSANFGASPSPLIAMVGATGTGKTIYLTVLAHALRNSLRRRFGADVHVAGATNRDEVEQVFRGNVLLSQTVQAIEGRREPMVFEWRQERQVAGVLRRLRTTYLSFYDTAGEDLSRQDTTHDLAYLGAADALILLLDPFMIPQARDRIRLPAAALRSKESTVDVVNRVTEKLRSTHGVRASRKIKIPVAVVFAKIDAFFDVLGADHPLLSPPPAAAAYDEIAGQATDEQIRALLHDWGADDIDAHLRLNYATFRYFAVSALGAPPDYDTMAIDAGGVRPFRVEEPLLWLLSRFSVVPRQRRGADS